MTTQIENSHSPHNLAQEVGQLQGAMPSLATKADVEKVSAILTWRMILVAGITQAIGVGAIIQLLGK